MSWRLDPARGLLVAAVIVVIAAIGGGLYLIGTPAHQRALRLDQQRASDLARLSFAIKAYARQHDKLPPSLAALDLGSDTQRTTTDPVSGAAYEYAVTAPKQYRLCATFSHDAAPRHLPSSIAAAPSLRLRAHLAGHDCFHLSIDSKDAGTQHTP